MNEVGNLAASQDDDYIELLNKIKSGFFDTIHDIFDKNPKKVEIINEVFELLKELDDILRGIYLIKEISPKVRDHVLSFGEKVSALIISRFIEKSIYIDSTKYIKTDNADTLLIDILQLYEKGLTQPLPFFPVTSNEYAQQITMGKSEEFALQKAHAVWIGNPHNQGESEDAYYAFFPGAHNPFSGAFAELALQIYRPIFLHEQVVEA